MTGMTSKAKQLNGGCMANNYMATLLGWRVTVLPTALKCLQWGEWAAVSWIYPDILFLWMKDKVAQPLLSCGYPFQLHKCEYGLLEMFCSQEGRFFHMLAFFIQGFCHKDHWDKRCLFYYIWCIQNHILGVNSAFHPQMTNTCLLWPPSSYGGHMRLSVGGSLSLMSWTSHYNLKDFWAFWCKPLK